MAGRTTLCPGMSISRDAELTAEGCRAPLRGRTSPTVDAALARLAQALAHGSERADMRPRAAGPCALNGRRCGCAAARAAATERSGRRWALRRRTDVRAAIRASGGDPGCGRRSALQAAIRAAGGDPRYGRRSATGRDPRFRAAIRATGRRSALPGGDPRYGRRSALRAAIRAPGGDPASRAAIQASGGDPGYEAAIRAAGAPTRAAANSDHIVL